MHKRTKIICTIGPACETKKTLTEMVKAGMNVCRLNFSHGSYENHAMLIENIRAVEQKTGEPVAILQDLQGPKIRVGVLPKSGVLLKENETVIFDTGATAYTCGRVPVDYTELHTQVKAGERLLLADGKFETKIIKVLGTRIETIVIAGGTIFSHKGINVPDSHLTVRAMTDKDKEDAKFGVQHGVDFIALSFVRTADDILDLRYLLKEYEKQLGLKNQHPIFIVAKIERGEAVKNIKEILSVVDGIMIARGDLGIEVPAAEVPLIQKKLIDEARTHGKPVIVATQMLDSMQENPRPTRAEVSDVANAVIDHTDAVMLSNETATGKFPVQTVETMATIITETEASQYDNLKEQFAAMKDEPVDEIISSMSRLIAERVHAKAILSASLSGETARLISKHRPELSIFVATSDPRVLHQMNLSWGVKPFLLEPCKSIEELVERSFAYLQKNKFVKSRDEIVVVAGEPVGQAGHVNLLEVREVK